MASQTGAERFRTEQPPYSLLVRGIELDVLPTAQRHGMGILTYSPLAGGWLSGSWPPTAPDLTGPAAAGGPLRHGAAGEPRKPEAVGELTKLAADAGLTMFELALASSSTTRRSPR